MRVFADDYRIRNGPGMREIDNELNFTAYDKRAQPIFVRRVCPQGIAAKVTSMDKMFTNSGLQKSNYCSLFTGPYRTVWNYFKSVLGISFTCP